jgi:hypothetical protein
MESGTARSVHFLTDDGQLQLAIYCSFRNLAENKNTNNRIHIGRVTLAGGPALEKCFGDRQTRWVIWRFLGYAAT